MKSIFVLIAIALLLPAASFAQSSEDPDVQHLDSLAAQLDTSSDNGALMHALDSLSATEPQDEGKIISIGKSDLSAGRIEEALAEFEKALELAPNDPRALSLKGKTLSQLGRPAQALPSLSKAIELDPSLAETRMDRAAAYNMMNKPEAALQDLQTAIAADTTLKHLARTSKYFQNLQSYPQFQKLVK